MMPLWGTLKLDKGPGYLLDVSLCSTRFITQLVSFPPWGVKCLLPLWGVLLW